MGGSVYIVANGARTSLGIGAAASAAAVRAAVSGIVEHPLMLDRLGNQVLTGLDAGLDPTMMGTCRLPALAETALREACEPLRGHRPGMFPRVPLHLALAETRPGFGDADVARVRTEISRVEGLPVSFGTVYVSPSGHAGGIAALKAAAAEIGGGSSDACLVGGVDSYLHPHTIEWLDSHRQLLGADARSAFVPGEGAGFCLLVSERGLNVLGVRPLARLVAAATGTETKLIKTAEVCLGEGLRATVKDALRGLSTPEQKVTDVICDMNGERYRGEEWGFVCLTCAEFFNDPTGYRSPADCWGDVGAASCPLFVMLACESAARGYANGNWFLLCAGSEKGLRGAVLLEAPVSN